MKTTFVILISLCPPVYALCFQPCYLDHPILFSLHQAKNFCKWILFKTGALNSQVHGSLHVSILSHSSFCYLLVDRNSLYSLSWLCAMGPYNQLLLSFVLKANTLQPTHCIPYMVLLCITTTMNFNFFDARMVRWLVEKSYIPCLHDSS